MRIDEKAPDREVLVALNRAAITARLMAGTVHEVNNALQIIATSVELIGQDALTPAVGKSIERITRQTERAAEALLALQRFTKAPLSDLERFDLSECVHQAVALRLYPASRLRVAMRVAPSRGEPVTAVGNAGYVQQAVLNLLVNAEQAMVGVAGEVVVTLRADVARVGVEVRDQGPGLSPEARAHLFEPFASTREPTDGVGLGLWASRSLAEMFQGSLDVDSGPEGTTVVLWLPRT